MTSRSRRQLGPKGFIVAQAILGSNQVGQESYMGQVPGQMIAIDLETFSEAAAEPGRLQHLVHGYLQVLWAQTAFGSACNARHEVEQRCAKWLLQTPRPGRHRDVRAGFIDYRRGRITIEDREGLETASCECYEKVRTEYSRLVPLA